MLRDRAARFHLGKLGTQARTKMERIARGGGITIDSSQSHTHTFQRVDARFAAGVLEAIWELERLSRDAVRQVAIRPSSERPAPEYELVRTHAERPPVYRAGVSALSEDFRSHVRHGPCHAGQGPALVIVHGDVKVCQMGMAVIIKQDVIRFEITVEGICAISAQFGGDCMGGTDR